jgi:hypothetical protein
MKRGRKNPADVEAAKPELTVIQGDFGKRRPDPPNGLTPRQTEIWRSIVDDEPLDYFSTQATQDMLKDYCVVRDKLEEITVVLNEFPMDAGLKNVKGIRHYLNLQKSFDYNMRAAVTLSTKLRLTNQSRYTALSAATASQNTLKGIKPWDWEK